MTFPLPPLKVGIYDPFEAYPKISEQLAEKVNLTNLHWRKNTQDALRSIPQLPFKIIEETPKFFDNHAPVTLEKIENPETALSDIKKLLETPYTRLMFIQCDSIDTYRSQVRPLVVAWKQSNIDQANCPIDWNLVFLQSDPSSKSQQKVFEKLKNDNNEVEGPEHCVLLKTTYLNELEESESWGVLGSKMKSSILFSFSKRLEILRDAILSIKENPLLTIALKEAVARQFFNLTLFEDALSEYHHLSRIVDEKKEALRSQTGEIRGFLELCKEENLFTTDSDDPSLIEIRSFIFSRIFIVLASLASRSSSLSVSSLHVSEILEAHKQFVNDVIEMFGNSISINEWACLFFLDMLNSDIVSKVLKMSEETADESIEHLAASFGDSVLLQRSRLLLLGSSLKGYRIDGILTDISMTESADLEATSEVLKQVLASKESFEAKFLELTEVSIQHFGLANRPRTVDTLSIDIALLDYQNSQYEKAALVLSSCPEFYGTQGWKFIGYSVLEIYIDCLEHMKPDDEFFTEPKEFILAENYVSLLSSMKEDCTVSQSVLSTTLQKLYSLNVDKSSPEIKYDIHELFSIELTPFISPLGHDTYAISGQVNTGSHLRFELKDVKISLVNETSHKLEFCKPELILDKPVSRIELQCTNIILGQFKINGITAKLGPISLSHEFAERKEVTIFASPKDLELRIDRSTILNLGYRSFSIFMKPLEDIKDIEVDFSQLGGIIELNGSMKFFNDDELLAELDDVKEIRYSDLESSKLYELVIPFKQDLVASKLIDIFARVKFHSTDGVSKSQSVINQLDTALQIEVSVQDIFKFNSLYSKFTIGPSDSRVPVRIIDVDLKSSDDYKIHSALKAHDIVAFAEQPGNYFFKLERAEDLNSDNSDLVLNVSHRDLFKECYEIWKSLLWSILRENRLELYFRLITNFLRLHVDYEQYQVNSKITFINKSLDTSVLGLIPSDDRSKITDLIHKFISQQHDPNSSDVPLTNQHLIIDVPIPTVELLQQYELKLEHSKIYTILGEELQAELTIKSILNKHKSSSSKKVSFKDQTSNKYEIEILPSNDSWLINGQTKFSFETHRSDEDNDNEQFSDKTYKLSFIPLKIGKLSLPRIKVTKEDISFKLDEYALEIDYKNENETIYVVSEKS